MPASTRKGDIGSGHGCHFPPTPSVAGSPDVFVNDLPAVRVGDANDAGCVSTSSEQGEKKIYCRQ